MRERPILFSGPMVRAILEGRKTQTRRVAKVHETSPGYISPNPYFVPRTPQEHASYCPHGIPGDRLWVRETFWYQAASYGEICGMKYQDGDEVLLFRADHNDTKGEGFDWRPSIFMPRLASRITLEITDVRVQRLQEISEEDAKSEGFGPRSARTLFRGTWETLNAKRGFGWDANPWVWALTFKRFEQGEA